MPRLREKEPLVRVGIGMPLCAGLHSICLETTQQTLERLLIYLVIFPASEITYMSVFSKFDCPRLCGFHHCLINANWKKNCLLSASFLCKRFGHLVFDPVTIDGVPGKNE
jgi:hypothetical protein